MDQIKPTASDFDLLAQMLDLSRSPEGLPISYRIGGKLYHGLPGAAQTSGEEGSCRHISASLSLGVLEVSAEIALWQDFPCAEWTVYLTNHGDSDSPLIDAFLALDGDFRGKNPVLVTNNGDFYDASGYAEAHSPLGEEKITLAPEGGRPCDHAFPYQRLLFDGKGCMISVGWPGQWQAEYQCAAGGAHVTAGQQVFSTVLHPGETLRSPRMTVLAFQGDECRGINLWRRFFYAHVLPRPDGKPVPPMVSISDNNGGIEFTESTEENQLRSIPRLKAVCPEANLWWIDAGWYASPIIDGRGEWTWTGEWKPDPVRYPRGFAPIGKACEENGLKLLVWFEPERVNDHSPIFGKLEKWVLRLKRSDGTFRANNLLDLTNDEAFQWLCESVSGLIRESGIRVYRQDFNFGPLDYWRKNEAADRQGALENLYIQRYLAYWDYLLSENPGLIIDSCASGGRRNDLETLRRAVPLHPTDYGYGYHPINQAFRRTLYGWFSYVRGWGEAWDADNEYYDHSDYYAAARIPPDTTEFFRYNAINAFAVMSPAAYWGDFEKHPERRELALRLGRARLRFGKIAESGDYYPLTADTRDATHWTVFQFNRPGQGDGAIQALRNNQCPEEHLTVRLGGVDESATYCFENAETGETFTLSGKALAHDGLTLALPLRGAEVLFYTVR